jgi:homoserine kinase
MTRQHETGGSRGNSPDQHPSPARHETGRSRGYSPDQAPDRCEVRVPATSANLGPGFDCLGLALGTYLHIAVTPSREVEIAGVGPPRPPSRNLTFKSYAAAFRSFGQEPPPLRFETIETYPSARGMGASASAIVAGLVLARAVGGLALSDRELAGLAVAIEGHADNVLPALFGGLVLATGASPEAGRPSSPEAGRPSSPEVPDVPWMRFEPPGAVSPLVLVARRGLRTSEARRVLPDVVPRADAVANASATGALVAILSGAAPPGGLLYATGDRLHEPYRLPLMPETRELHARLRERGIATALSGAGPSLLCLVEAARLEEAQAAAEALMPYGWQVLAPGWDVEGARVLV